MERKKLFNEIMKSLILSAEYINKYENTNRKYGTDDVLYPVECHTIELIGNNPEISITEISRKMKKTKSAVSQLIDRLVKKGYLEKKIHPLSARSYLLLLTESGEIIHNHHKQFDLESYDEIFDCVEEFSVRELQTFLQIQKILNTKLKFNAENKK